MTTLACGAGALAQKHVISEDGPADDESCSTCSTASSCSPGRGRRRWRSSSPSRASDATWSSGSSSSGASSVASSVASSPAAAGETEIRRELSEVELISVLGKSLTTLSSNNDVATVDKAFVGASVPKISLTDYFIRMARYLNEWQRDKVDGISIGLRSLVISMIYVDRICQRNPDFVLTRTNVHRVCMVAVLAATKVVEDCPCANSFWARVGGVSLKELNDLERQLMSKIGWNLTVSQEQFFATLAMVSKSVPDA